MPTNSFLHLAANPAGQFTGVASFAHQLAARRSHDDDSEEQEPGPDNDELWDPDTLDDDEPEPEPGDFWLDSDDQ